MSKLHTARLRRVPASFGRQQPRIAADNSEDQFRLILQHTSDMLTIFDELGTIIYQSPSFERMLGYAPDERVGQNVFVADHIVHPDDLPTKQRMLQTAIDHPDRDVKAEFDVSEEIQKYFSGMTGDQIRAEVEQRAQAWQPFWFHQGHDLGTFNTFDGVLRDGMRAIVQTHPDQRHPFPDSLFFLDSLREWSKHLKMAILTYGAYFGAFYEPFQQYVGGGADVVWAARPQIPPFQ